MKKSEANAGVGAQFKVVLSLVLALAAAFALVAAFGAGFVSGVIVMSGDAEEFCERDGGDWNSDTRSCERQVAEQGAPAGPTQGVQVFACEDGTRLEVEQVDPELIHVSPVDGTGTVYYLPVVSLGNLGPSYSSGEVSMGFQGSGAVYENGEAGVSTTCAIASN